MEPSHHIQGEGIACSHVIQVGALRIQVKATTSNSLLGSSVVNNIIKLSLRDFNGELEIETMPMLGNPVKVASRRKTKRGLPDTSDAPSDGRARKRLLVNAPTQPFGAEASISGDPLQGHAAGQISLLIDDASHIMASGSLEDGVKEAVVDLPKPRRGRGKATLPKIPKPKSILKRNAANLKDASTDGTVVKKRGRPRKDEAEPTITPKRGRPFKQRKLVSDTINEPDQPTSVKRGRGRAQSKATTTKTIGTEKTTKDKRVPKRRSKTDSPVVALSPPKDTGGDTMPHETIIPTPFPVVTHVGEYISYSPLQVAEPPVPSSKPGYPVATRTIGPGPSAEIDKTNSTLDAIDCSQPDQDLVLQNGGI